VGFWERQNSIQDAHKGCPILLKQHQLPQEFSPDLT
jgi:hypothetical protein